MSVAAVSVIVAVVVSEADNEMLSTFEFVALVSVVDVVTVAAVFIVVAMAVVVSTVAP